jgi:hypothetical protein
MTLQRVGLSGHDDHPVRVLLTGDPERVTPPFTMHLGPIRTRRTEFRDPDLGRRVESRPVRGCTGCAGSRGCAGPFGGTRSLGCSGSRYLPAPRVIGQNATARVPRPPPDL